ncbi:MAG TPA: sulfatase-like hydrolase/transferase [Pilimelia sp.]|nr:sulfatase-like hydrolase/transferase [Pilimelia sp.]
MPDPASRLARLRAALGRVWRPEALAFLEIAALSGVVVAQPVLDVMGRSPDFFLFHGAGPADVLLLLAILVLAVPLVLWGAGALVGLAGRRARRAVHVGTLGVLATLLAVQVGKEALPVRGVPLVLLAAAAGAALIVAYARWDPARQLVRLAAVGPLVFAALFVFSSPTSAVLLGGRSTAGPAGTPGAAPGVTGAAGAADAAPGRPSAGGPGSTSPAGPDQQPPIVLIVLDELPLLSLLDGAGRVDKARYPNFAALAGGSTWYRNATAVSGWTPYALPAMLTGRYPRTGAAPHYSRYPNNLFTLLGGSYDLRVQESITQLCPPQMCDRAAQGRGGLPTMLGESAALLQEIVSPAQTPRDPTADFVEPTVAEGDAAAPTDPKFRWDRLDDNQPVRFREFVTGLRPAARPTAHVLHLLLPHTPWRYLPSGVRYEAPEKLPTDGEWWPRLARERHQLQLGYADRLLGETLAALRSTGLYDDSLVVVTADHGVSFTRGEVGRGMGAVRASPAEVLWVPTFVKAPGQRAGAVDDRNWQHVDLVPTIADYAGLSVPWEVDGRSARGTPRPETEKSFYDVPAQKVTVDGAAGLAVIAKGAAAGVPPLPAQPAPTLLGRPVAGLPVRDGGPRVTVANAADFQTVTAAQVPAVVYGTAPPELPAGATLAIAVNGRIGAVVPVLAERAGVPRFAGLLPDESLFTPGANRLELFEVVDGGTALRRLAL